MDRAFAGGRTFGMKMAEKIPITVRTVSLQRHIPRNAGDPDFCRRQAARRPAEGWLFSSFPQGIHPCGNVFLLVWPNYDNFAVGCFCGIAGLKACGKTGCASRTDFFNILLQE
jgi:hypothetical protein